MARAPGCCRLRGDANAGVLVEPRALQPRSGLAAAVFRRAEEVLEKPLRRVEKVTGDEEVLRLTIADFLNSISVEVEEDGARVAQDDGRVSGDEKLRMARCREVVDDLEERELSLRRQRRLRLIEDVDSLLEAIGEQRNEGFSVGLLV